jgi:hypothetical protein
MEIIRKELTPNELFPSNLRYNSGSDQVQQTLDGGSTWVNSPADDPRHNPANLVPLRTTGSVQCDSAAAMTAQFKRYVDQAITDLTVAEYLTDAAGILGGVFLELGILFDIVAYAFSAIFSIGASTLTSDFTPTVYQTITNILFCDIGADGSVSASQLVRINADILAQLGGTVSLVWNYVMTSEGEVGLQNAGTIGSVTGSCSGTGCEYGLVLDFTIDKYGGQSANVDVGVLLSRGQYIPGYGWVQTDSGSTSLLQLFVHLLGTSGDYLIDEIEVYADGTLTPYATNGQTVAYYDHAHLYTTGTTVIARTSVSGDTSFGGAGAFTMQGLVALNFSNAAGTRSRIYRLVFTWHAGAGAPAYTPNL